MRLSAWLQAFALALPVLAQGLLEAGLAPSSESNLLNWKKGFCSNGASLTLSIASEGVCEGKAALKLEYSFSMPGSVEIWCAEPIEKAPYGVSVSVKGSNDNALGCFLRLKDSSGETFQWTCSPFSSKQEWTRLEFVLDSPNTKWGGDKNGQFNWPSSSTGLLISSASAASGSLLVDAIALHEKPQAQAPAPAQAASAKEQARPSSAKAAKESLPAELELQQLLNASSKVPQKAAEKAAAPAAPKPVVLESPLPAPKGQLDDAALPEGVALDWSLANCWRQETATRGRLCVNGLWRFRPAWDSDRELPASGSGWGYLKVPGGWPCSHRWGHNPYSFIPIAPKCWADAVGAIDPDRGNWHFRNRNVGEPIPFDKVKDAWYERGVEIPQEWAGRRIALRFDMVEQDARVYVNSKLAGRLRWPGGSLDISSMAKPGGENLITVRVFTPGIPDGDGPRGIAGDVYLESEARSFSRVADAFPFASWRNKSVTVKAVFERLDPFGSYQVVAKFSANGKVERSFESKSFQVADLAGGLKSFTWDWPDPRLWDFDKGELYDFTLALLDSKGETIDESLPRRFGFREFYIEGKNFMLNGRKTHFFSEYYREYGRSFANVGREACLDFLDNFRKAGFNLVKLSIYDYNPRLAYYPDEMVRAADEKGVPLLFQLPRISANNADYAAWKDWRRKIDGIVNRWKDSPCILFWSTDQGTGHFIEALDPANFKGYNQFLPMKTEFWNQVRLGIDETEDYINNIDGSRVVAHSGAGNAARMVSIYPYYNFDEIQEQREHPVDWVKSGSKPLYYFEWGIPFIASFTGWRKNNPYPATAGIPFKDIQPYPMEFSAITQGDAAYALDPKTRGYAKYLDRIWKEGEGSGRWMYKFFFSDINCQELAIEQNFLTTQNERLLELAPYFRAMEISGLTPFSPTPFLSVGGSVPVKDHWPSATDWKALQRPGIHPDIRIPGDPYSYPKEMMGRFIRPTSQYYALKKAFAPAIAFIAGGPSEITRQDHIYSSGERVGKQLVLVNDRNSSLAAVCRWTLSFDGKTLQSGKIALEAKPGEVARALLAFNAPEARTSQRLLLSASFTDSSGAVFSDGSMELSILPAQKPSGQAAQTALWDPKGLSAESLRKAGVAFHELKSPDLSSLSKDVKTLVIGRQALDSGEHLKDVAKLVRSGLSLLLLEQSQDALRKRLGFRTNDPAPRKAWARVQGHQAFKGLPEGSLSFWRGSSTMLEAYPEYHSEYPYAMAPQAYVDWLGFKNKHVWKWGNTHAVASAIIEKPHTGNFTALADCGFDLAFATLLEFKEGKGRAILCQFDVSCRTEEEPAASLLLSNLLSYLNSSPQPEFRGVQADEAAAKLLAELKIESSPLGDSASEALLAIAAPTSVSHPLPSGFSCAAFLGLDGESLSKAVGAKIQTDRSLESSCVVDAKSLPVLAGLGSSDFYWRGELEIPALKASPGLAATSNGAFGFLAKDGKSFIFCQFLPAGFDYEARPHVKLSKLKALRALRQTLCNAGASSQSPFLEYLESPAGKDGKPRWLASYYSNIPEADDDPYRYQHW